MGYIAFTIWDAIYVTKSREGQAVTDFLADHPFSGSSKLYDNLPDKITEVCMTQTSFEEQVWQLFFDDASRTGLKGNIVGVGVVRISTKLRNFSCIFINRVVF